MIELNTNATDQLVIERRRQIMTRAVLTTELASGSTQRFTRFRYFTDSNMSHQSQDKTTVHNHNINEERNDLTAVYRPANRINADFNIQRRRDYNTARTNNTLNV